MAFRGRVDIVNGFNISWENTMFTGWQWARQNDVPFVATPFMHFGAGNDDRVQRNALMDHQRLMLRNASAVLTLTDIEAQGIYSNTVLCRSGRNNRWRSRSLPRLGTMKPFCANMIFNRLISSMSACQSG